MKRPRPSQLLVPFMVVVAVVGALYASRGSVESSKSPAAPMGGVAASATLELVADGAAPAPRAAAESSGALGAMFASRKLIRTATISLEVGGYSAAAEKAASIAAAYGGYLADSQVSRENGGRARGALTLRVRADRFEEALRAFEGLGKVEAASVDAQDVSREYMDLETRLAVKREAQARMRALMQVRTARLADILEAEKELSRSIEESERLEGERRYFDQQVALSTVRLELHEPPAFLERSALTPLRDAVRAALPILGRSAAALVSGAAAVLPWALVGAVVWQVRRRLVSRRVLRAVTEN